MAKKSRLKVKMVKSPIGSPRKMRENLIGLGLTRMNQERDLEDTPSVRGMIYKVRHLVEVDPPRAGK